MDLIDVTWQGPRIDDSDLLTRLPADYAALLTQVNGFIQFDGGLHVRGICGEPLWHSLQHVWTGDLALHKLYTTLTPDDVPFAQNATGDQFILREASVHRLHAGADELEPLATTLTDFMTAAQADPDELLGLRALLQFRAEGNTLKPGQSISVYPPFIFEQSAEGVSLAAVPTLELIAFHADLARQIAGLPDGARVKLTVSKPRRRWWRRRDRSSR